MNGFLRQHNVVKYLPPFYEASLVLWYDVRQEILEPVGNNFGYKLVACVAKGDGPESAEIVGPFFFRDQG